MKILNLDNDFKPHGEGLAYESINFPSGCEPHIKISDVFAESILITCRIKTSDDIIRLLLATHAIRNAGVKEISLFMPYLPFARQDRVMVTGEPLSLKIMADMINQAHYERVRFYDVHSEVSTALINRSESIPNHSFVNAVLTEKSNFQIVCPDAGAYKKIYKLCQAIDYPGEISMCNKVRNLQTGQIIKTVCDTQDFSGKDLYIVDDICDGGGTFSLLASELRKRNCGKINLIVSHGIFSKGTEIEGVDHIYCTDAFKDVENTEKLTQVKLCTLF